MKVPSGQRYVSDELTHFVGRGLKTPEDRYLLLERIIRGGILKAPGQSDHSTTPSPTGGDQVTIRTSVTVSHDERLSSNRKYSASIVCFADIPLADLRFHIAKYSPFGISFTKPFLIRFGANPVFYVATHSATNVRNPAANEARNQEDLRHRTGQTRNAGHWENYTRGELFDEAERLQQAVVPTYESFDPFGKRPSSPPGFPGQELVQQFYLWYLFPYMKFFDPELSDEHPDNYYMEREWRTITPVQFRVEDIQRVLIPQQFAARFRNDFPGFVGQLTFSD